MFGYHYLKCLMCKERDITCFDRYHAVASCSHTINHICLDCKGNLKHHLMSIIDLDNYRCDHVLTLSSYLFKSNVKHDVYMRVCALCSVFIDEIKLMRKNISLTLFKRCTEVVIKHPKLLIDLIERYSTNEYIWKDMYNCVYNRNCNDNNDKSNTKRECDWKYKVFSFAFSKEKESN